MELNCADAMQHVTAGWHNRGINARPSPHEMFIRWIRRARAEPHGWQKSCRGLRLERCDVVERPQWQQQLENAYSEHYYWAER